MLRGDLLRASVALVAAAVVVALDATPSVASITSTFPFSQSQPYATVVQLDASVATASSLSAELLPVYSASGGADLANSDCPAVKDQQTPPPADPVNLSPATTAVGPGSFTATLSGNPPAPGAYLFCAYADNQLLETDAVTVNAPPTTLNVSGVPTAAGFSITASGTTALLSELLVAPLYDCVGPLSPGCVASAIDASAPILLPPGPFSVTFQPYSSGWGSMVAWLAPVGGLPAWNFQYFYLSAAMYVAPSATVLAPTPAPAPTPMPAPPSTPTLPTARFTLGAERLATSLRRGVRAWVTCGGSCIVRLVLTASDLRRHGRTLSSPRTLGTLTAELSDAGTSDILIPLSTTGRRLLRGVTSARVSATATLSAPGVPTTLKLSGAAVTLGR